MENTQERFKTPYDYVIAVVAIAMVVYQLLHTVSCVSCRAHEYPPVFSLVLGWLVAARNSTGCCGLFRSSSCAVHHRDGICLRVLRGTGQYLRLPQYHPAHHRGHRHRGGPGGHRRTYASSCRPCCNSHGLRLPRELSAGSFPHTVLRPGMIISRLPSVFRVLWRGPGDLCQLHFLFIVFGALLKALAPPISSSRWAGRFGKSSRADLPWQRSSVAPHGHGHRGPTPNVAVVGPLPSRS